MNRQQAIACTVHGAIAALVSGTLTTAFGVDALTGPADNANALNLSPLVIVDGLILFALAYGMYRRSRAASVTALVYSIFNIIAKLCLHGVAGFSALQLVFVCLYYRAMEGAFVIHLLDSPDGSDNRTHNSG